MQDAKQADKKQQQSNPSAVGIESPAQIGHDQEGELMVQ